ncbi:hypothetical protein BJY01DRAFT_235841 [Aspergillus pseudoustus]|uniref:Zn(2)-C6 fungal-type domain-containing protein n=1 Tax=Aspergillus pseudoustus TaxID=1810923 RepID=A0ABR4JS96_9EURO
MPRFEARPIKRPRISLSCLVCRRRKVRCGREHPECTNCVRMKEKCAYQPTDLSDSTGQAFPVSPEASDRNGSEPIAVNKELTWSHWIPEGADNGIGTLHNERAAAGEEKASQTVTSCSPVVPIFNNSEAASHGVGDTIPGALPCADYLSLRRGGRGRYIGQAFWGTVAGKESESDNFFDNDRNSNPDLPPSHISAVALFTLLRSLPTRPASDALLDIFFYAVWPVTPLIHALTLRADYDEFWEWCANNQTALAPSKLCDDPTFFCLLFGVLYCGASAAAEACWTSGALQGLPKEATVSQLRNAYDTSLSFCQHLEHPTMNSLVSMLLTWPFTPGAEPMRDVLSVGTIVRLAQSMGLHREGNFGSALGDQERENRRRVWWYIVRLDVHASISSGLPTCIGSDALGQVNMISDAGEDEGHEAPGHSIASMFFIGRAQACCLHSRIAACVQSGSDMTEYNLREHLIAARKVQEMTESLISRIPAQGLPEQGFIPSRLANASPLIHPSLFRDDSTTQPTVLGAWARIILTLQIFDVAILLRKPLLPPPDISNPQSCESWTSMARLCVGYLRILIPVYQTPAFKPYMWYLRGCHGPLQCVYLTIIYLEIFKSSNDVPLARYFVDEAIAHLVSHSQASHYSSGVDTDSQRSSPKAQTPLAVRVLVELHSRLHSTTASGPLSRSPEATTPQNIPPATENSANLDTGLLAVVAELEAWSSSLIV